MMSFTNYLAIRAWPPTGRRAERYHAAYRPLRDHTLQLLSLSHSRMTLNSLTHRYHRSEINAFHAAAFNASVEQSLTVRRMRTVETIIGQVALLWQRDCATRLSVEILQLQNIPIVWHYLRDPTFSRFYTIPECDRHTHRNGRTDTRRRHVLR